MKRFINKCAVAVACLLCAGAAWAEAEKPAPKTKDYAACLAAWDKNMRTLQTDFVQSTSYDGLLISRSGGRLYYRQKGPALRLDNMDGETVSQSALTDKKTIFILDEKGKEVSKLSWNEWLQSQPNQALFDFGNYTALLDRHDVLTSAPENGSVRLTLTPKGKKDYTLYVTVKESDCFPQSITVQAELMSTQAVLSETVLNKPLVETIFKGLK